MLRIASTYVEGIKDRQYQAGVIMLHDLDVRFEEPQAGSFGGGSLIASPPPAPSDSAALLLTLGVFHSQRHPVFLHMCRTVII